MNLPSFPTSDPVLIFALVMGIILVAPLVCARLRIPGLIGLIVAGAIVGPNGARLMERGETMSLLGTVGLLYIVFTAALEMDLAQFIRYRHRSLFFGSISFLVPQTVGALLGHYLLGFGWPEALLLGSMLAPHTLLTYPIVSRLGISKNAAVVTVVGGTIVSDTAALLMLAVIARRTTGELDGAFWIQFLASMSVFLALVAFGLPRLGRWFFRNVLAESTAQFAFILACVFTFAYLAKVAGLQTLIGAFLAGLALNRLIPPSGPLMNRIQFVGHALLIPFFLISVGMLVDVRVFAGGWTSWTVALVMIGVVVGSKFAASMISMRAFRFSRVQGMVMFGMSVNKAAATLAVVFVGVELGLFDEVVLNGAVMLILVSCMLGAWVTEKYGRRLAMRDASGPAEVLERPERILVPLANPANAPLLVDLALMVRSKNSHEPLYPLMVAREDVDVDGQVARSEKLLSVAVMHAAAADVPVSPVTRVDGNVASGMVRAVRELRTSHVIVGWDGKPSSRWHVLGRTLDDFVAQTSQMVMACRMHEPLNVDSRVVVLVPPFADREPGFREAAQALKNLASELGAPLVLVATGLSLARLGQAFGELRPEVVLENHEIADWNTVPAGLPHAEGDPDLVVLLSARQGRLSWRPNLETLPGIIARRWPLLDFIVLYPAEVAAEAAEELRLAAPRPDPLAALGIEDIQLGLESADGEAAVRALLERRLGRQPAALEEALAAVWAGALDVSVEVSPGVALLHAHVRGLSAPLLEVGVSRKGLTFPHIDDPVHVVLILVGPESDRGERHLAMLSSVAQMMRPAHLVEQLTTATTPAQARAILLRSLTAGAQFKTPVESR